jgi:hypothetical protein
MGRPPDFEDFRPTVHAESVQKGTGGLKKQIALFPDERQYHEFLIFWKRTLPTIPPPSFEKWKESDARVNGFPTDPPNLK